MSRGKDHLLQVMKEIAGSAKPAKKRGRKAPRTTVAPSEDKARREAREAKEKAEWIQRAIKGPIDWDVT